MLVGFILGIVEGTAGRKNARKLIPLVGGMFIFILLANYSGLLPGFGTIGFYKDVPVEESHDATTTNANTVPVQIASTDATADVLQSSSEDANTETEKELVPFLRAPNADINMTLAMALVTFTAVQYYGIKAHGVRGRVKHMAQPAFLFPIEVIGEFSRVISLSARLFGNVFAGEVLMAVMVAMANAIKIILFPVLIPVIFLFLEVLFGSIQALVFALLTAIYITLAMAGTEDHEEAHDHAEIPAATPAMAGSHGD